MSDEQGRHAASPQPAEAPPGNDVFARPSGIDGGFDARSEPAPYTPPPMTVSPEERATFGRPTEAGAFAPLSGERLVPQPNYRPPVPAELADTFAATPQAQNGFAPQPGARLDASGPHRESPWWKPDAVRDPWRDPSSQFWLGRGAVFSGGRPAQIDPTDDVETEDELLGGVEDEPVPDNVRRGRFGLPSLLVVLIATLVAGVVGGGVGWFATRETNDALHRPDASIAQVETPTKRPAGSVAGVAKRVGPAVVSILVTTDSEAAIGSGVVIDKDGDVLTNNHVIAAANGDRMATIRVTFSNEATASAQIVGTDPVSDLAVIKVPNTELTVATLGRSDQVAVGDQAIAIGSPLGLQGTVTAGIISALNRPVHVYADDGTSDAYLDAIQTDAPINPGNSGGALVNSSGAVIGINSAASVGSSDSGTSASGIGYAIPINYAKAIATDLIRTGKTSHASLGAQAKTYLTSAKTGAYLAQVSPGKAAAKAGLKAGDVIVVVDKTVIQSADQLIVVVQQLKPGARVKVTYYPKGSSAKKTVTVTLQ
ncbi:trypsin-like peptidase domain-containing protein [uncultured Jatrophihabitans sp.]|uniref:trypsin-like peptidase domain-containing protein n=1 Tax=uncultured Jatrophihabitans sp. TaxID=1610747 RepID=UPI0035CA7F8C